MYVIFANNPLINQFNNVINMCANISCTAVLLNHGTHKHFVMGNFPNVLWYARFNPFAKEINGIESITFYQQRINHTYLVSNAYTCARKLKNDDNKELRKFQTKLNSSSILTEQSMRILNCIPKTLRSLSTGIISALHLRRKSEIHLVGFSKWKSKKKTCHDYATEWELFHNNTRMCRFKYT
jgi:hypothetical protein